MIVNGERALAYVVTIDEIKPIEGYDRVEYARTSGWWIVISKAYNLKVGDKCVYFEIDSKVPETDKRFEFLAPKKYRIKTQKMCKVYSQGLLIPVSEFPEIGEDPAVGTDVTKQLGVTYYVAEDNTRKSTPNQMDFVKRDHKRFFNNPVIKKLMRFRWFREIVLFLFNGKKKAKKYGFPGFVSKTDEDRVENQPFRVGDGKEYILTEKCLSNRMHIRTEDGTTPISDIVNKKLPIKVATYNFDTKKVEYQPIREYHRIEQSDIEKHYRIGVAHRGKGNRPKYIECTAGHKILVNGNWVRADEVKVGDTLSHYSEEVPTEAFEMLLGSLIGDSTFNIKGNYICVEFSHSEKQKDYFDYKCSILGKYISSVNERTSGYGSHIYASVVKSNLFIDKYIRNNCVVDGKKTLTKRWTDDMTPISLAFWYLDDGVISNRENDHLGERIYLSTNALSYEECELLIQMLLRYGIEGKINTKESYKGNVISLGVEATQKFCSLIAPYVCSSMKYKLPKRFENMPCVFEYFKPIYTNGIVETQVLSVEEFEPKHFSGIMYDITTDNHNYFAQGVLVHNCDGTSCTYALERKGRRKFEYYVCSRNVRLLDPKQRNYITDNGGSNIYWEMSDKYNIEQHLKDYLISHPECKWVCIQGEGVGNVQSNPLKLAENDLYVFNFIDSQVGRYGPYEGQKIINSWGMKWVPILGYGKTQNTMEELKEFADGKSVVNPKVIREGIVYRTPDGKDSFKNVSRKYLLKQE